MRELEHFVGGKSVAGTSGRHGPVFDPARGVQSATVTLAENRAVIAYDPAKVTTAQMTQAIEEEGYDASSL